MLTTLEAKMVEAIGRNDYNSGDPAAPVWSDCLDCTRGPVVPAVQRPGVVASLVKKGFARSDHETVWLTSAGLAAFTSIMAGR